MDTAKRMQLIRVLEKMERNPEFSKKLGIGNKSEFRPEKECRQKEEKNVIVIICNMFNLGIW